MGETSYFASSFANRLDVDGSDGAIGRVEVSVARREGTDGEEISVAEIIGDAVQAPAGELLLTKLAS